jgi:hypothetical protein
MSLDVRLWRVHYSRFAFHRAGHDSPDADFYKNKSSRCEITLMDFKPSHFCMGFRITMI